MNRQPYFATLADHAAEFAAFMRLNRRITTLRPDPPEPAPTRSPALLPKGKQYANIEAMMNDLLVSKLFGSGGGSTGKL